jgi:hypothetical protein
MSLLQKLAGKFRLALGVKGKGNQVHLVGWQIGLAEDREIGPVIPAFLACALGQIQVKKAADNLPWRALPGQSRSQLGAAERGTKHSIAGELCDLLDQ